MSYEYASPSSKPEMVIVPPFGAEVLSNEAEAGDKDPGTTVKLEPLNAGAPPDTVVVAVPAKQSSTVFSTIGSRKVIGYGFPVS